MSMLKDFIEIIEEKNRRIVDEQKMYDSLLVKFQYLLYHVVESEDGVFTFPDGDRWDCGKKLTLRGNDNE